MSHFKIRCHICHQLAYIPSSFQTLVNSFGFHTKILLKIVNWLLRAKCLMTGMTHFLTLDFYKSVSICIFWTYKASLLINFCNLFFKSQHKKKQWKIRLWNFSKIKNLLTLEKIFHVELRVISNRYAIFELQNEMRVCLE